MHVLFGKVDVSETDVLQGVELDLFISGDFAHDLNLAVLDDGVPVAFCPEAVDHPDVGVRHGVRVIVRVHLAHIGLFPVEVQPRHMILLGFDHVDRIRVDRGEGAVPVHLGNDLMVPGFRGVDDHDVFGIDAPQTDFIGGVAFRRPVPAVGHTVQDPLVFEVIEKLLQIFLSETLAFFEREFEGRAFQVMKQDEKVVGIHAAVLGRAGEEVVRMFDDELVHGAAPGDQNGKALSRATADPSGLLPGAGDGTRIADHDAGLQIADVDPQFQGVGAHHAHHLAIPQSRFDLAPQVGEIAAPVSGHEPRVERLSPAEPVLQVFGQYLDVQAAGGENDRLDGVGDEVRGQLSGHGQGGLPDTELAVHDRRVAENERFGGRRGAALCDHRDRPFEQVLRMLAGVGHGRGTADENRVLTVEAADSHQPADDVRQVRPENAPVDMQLVDDDVLQVAEELQPFGVVGENPRMEHIGVGHHDMALPADGPAGVVRRVAVIGVGPDVTAQFMDQAMHFVHLVLGEGLGGKQVEGAALRRFENPLKHGQVVAQRLAAGRGRHQQHMLPVPSFLDRFGLMAVELSDAPLFEDKTEAGVNPARKGGVTAFRGRKSPERRHGFHEAPVVCQPGQPFVHGEFGHKPFLAADQRRLSFFCSYMAVSARVIRSSSVRGSSGSNAAQPMLMCNWYERFASALWRSNWCCRRFRRYSGLMSAVLRERMANSSPPIRAMMSASRKVFFRIEATSMMARSPSRWPRASLMIFM